MPPNLPTACRALTAADQPGFATALSTVYEQIAAATPADRQAAMVHLSGRLELLDPAPASWAATVVALLTEYGADPAPAVPPVLGCLKTVAEGAGYFADAWYEVSDEPLPDPAGVPDRRIRRLLERGLGDATEVVLEAWASLPRWAAAALAVLRVVVPPDGPDTAQLVRAVTGAEPYCADLAPVRRLLTEPATVPI
ncbi:hypothetical protein AB0I55_26825 [Actinocatenispora sera]|uniref:hypothetical protein n=1 Tax=Actinocatenispora sera TaxID=390989 RepID=UPI0033C40582